MAGPGHARRHQRVVGARHGGHADGRARERSGRHVRARQRSVRGRAGVAGPVRSARATADDISWHTLVVHREEGGRYLGGREPFLQRWLFSPRLGVIALIVALGIGLGVGGWWLTTGRYASVPVVAGDSQAMATAALTMDGFTVTARRQVHSNDVPQGMVVGTSPSGRAAQGSAITILISAGPFTSIVPVGEARHARRGRGRLAARAPDATGSSRSAPTPRSAPCSARTRPAGTTWPQTKPVAILVAAGPPLPNFVGDERAGRRAVGAGSTASPCNSSRTRTARQPQGTITGQQPAAGVGVPAGPDRDRQVSAAPALVNVPDVIGMTGRTRRRGSLKPPDSRSRWTRSAWRRQRRVFDYSPVGQAPPGSTIILEVLPGGLTAGGPAELEPPP